VSITAYDSATPSLIPSNPPAIFPYADGVYAWSHKRFTRAAYRYITVEGNPAADIIDVEPGCVWPPANAGTWAKDRHRHHSEDLTVYCNRANLPAIRAVMDDLGFAWHLFLAAWQEPALTEYDGIKLRACQYFAGDDYDMSKVYDEGWLNKP